VDNFDAAAADNLNPQAQGGIGRTLGLDPGYMGIDARVDLRPSFATVNVGAIDEMHFAER
jgi:hypothetical protein